MIIVVPSFIVTGLLAYAIFYVLGSLTVTSVIGLAAIAALIVLYWFGRLVWEIGSSLWGDFRRWWRTADARTKRNAVIQASLYPAFFTPTLLSLLFQFYPPFPGFRSSVLGMALLLVPVALAMVGFSALMIAAAVIKLRARRHS